MRTRWSFQGYVEFGNSISRGSFEHDGHTSRWHLSGLCTKMTCLFLALYRTVQAASTCDHHAIDAIDYFPLIDANDHVSVIPTEQNISTTTFKFKLGIYCHHLFCPLVVHSCSGSGSSIWLANDKLLQPSLGHPRSLESCTANRVMGTLRSQYAAAGKNLGRPVNLRSSPPRRPSERKAPAFLRA